MSATKKIYPVVINFSFVVCLVGLLLGATQLQAQEVLPFPKTPTASTTGKTLADSKHQSRETENHLPKDAPNIVVKTGDT